MRFSTVDRALIEAESAEVERRLATGERVIIETKWGPLVLVPVDPSEAAEHMIDEGRAELAAGNLAQWFRERLGRDPTREQLAIAAELLETTYQPPEVRLAWDGASAPPRGRWRGVSTIWTDVLRNPLGRFWSDIRLRLLARRADAKRAASGRTKLRRVEVEVAEGETANHLRLDAGLTAIAAADEASARDARRDILALIEAAEARGVGLSPLERKALWGSVEGYAAIARELGSAAPTVRSAAWRARQKLRSTAGL